MVSYRFVVLWLLCGCFSVRSRNLHVLNLSETKPTLYLMLYCSPGIVADSLLPSTRAHL